MHAVVCVPVGAWVGGVCGVPVDWWVATCRAFLRTRWRLREGSSCVICRWRARETFVGSYSGWPSVLSAP